MPPSAEVKARCSFGKALLFGSVLRIRAELFIFYLQIFIMIFEAAGSVLVALGLLAIFLAFSSKKGDAHTIAVLVVSLFFIVAGGWLIIGSIGFYVLAKKAIGLLIVAVGAFTVFKFPSSFYQEEYFKAIAVFIGLILLIFGLYLALF